VAALSVLLDVRNFLNEIGDDSVHSFHEDGIKLERDDSLPRALLLEESGTGRPGLRGDKPELAASPLGESSPLLLDPTTPPDSLLMRSELRDGSLGLSPFLGLSNFLRGPASLS